MFSRDRVVFVLSGIGADVRALRDRADVRALRDRADVRALRDRADVRAIGDWCGRNTCG